MLYQPRVAYGGDGHKGDEELRAGIAPFKLSGTNLRYLKRELLR